MEKKTGKSFGYLFFVIFLILGFWPLTSFNEFNIIFLIISLIFLVLAITDSFILSFLNIYWIKFGEFLGGIIAPLIMFIIFFVIVTPIALLLKLFKKDLLNIKFNKSKSYWVEKVKKVDSMDKQF